MKTLLRTLILLALIGGGLHLTNPDQEAFSTFLSEYVQETLADDVPGETDFGKRLRKGLGNLAGAAGGAMAKRNDLQVASVYRIDMAGIRYTFLGVAGRFILLSKGED